MKNLSGLHFALLLSSIGLNHCAVDNSVTASSQSANNKSSSETLETEIIVTDFGLTEVQGHRIKDEKGNPVGFKFGGGDVIVSKPSQIPTFGLKSEDEDFELAMISYEQYKWKNGVVPFTVHPAFKYMNQVNQAMAEFHAKTPIRFVQRTNEPDYLVITNESTGLGDVSNACGISYLGRNGGPQPLFFNVRPDCEPRLLGVAIHEIMHALGAWHEHARPDRDQFLNISPRGPNTSPIEIAPHVQVAQLTPYDVNSITHYETGQFVGLGYNVTKKDGSPLIRQMKLSNLDVQGLNIRYAAPQNTTPQQPIQSADKLIWISSMHDVKCGGGNPAQRGQAHPVYKSYMMCAASSNSPTGFAWKSGLHGKTCKQQGKSHPLYGDLLCKKM